LIAPASDDGEREARDVSKGILKGLFCSTLAAIVTLGGAALPADRNGLIKISIKPGLNKIISRNGRTDITYIIEVADDSFDQSSGNELIVMGHGPSQTSQDGPPERVIVVGNGLNPNIPIKQGDDCLLDDAEVYTSGEATYLVESERDVMSKGDIRDFVGPSDPAKYRISIFRLFKNVSRTPGIPWLYFKLLHAEEPGIYVCELSEVEQLSRRVIAKYVSHPKNVGP
jgi:hypothetical protein